MKIDGQAAIVTSCASGLGEATARELARLGAKVAADANGLPVARDLALPAIRVCTVAPGLFAVPLMKQLPDAARSSLAASITSLPSVLQGACP